MCQQETFDFALTPAPFARRRVEGRRLAYYLAAADIAFWDRHWQASLSPETYRWAKRGHLGHFEKPFVRYLPKRGRILEAGCGTGKYVLALRVRGYDVEGIEWSAETVRRVHTILPDLPIQVGDVTSLEVPDSTYGGYISLGVVEHRKAGPEPFLREAHRVLDHGGVMLISVPHFHALRRAKASLGLYQGNPQGLDFYQYAFTPSEFTTLVGRCGFEILETFSYNAHKGIKDEIPFLRRRLRKHDLIGKLLWKALTAVTYPSLVESNFGHMLMVAARRIG